MQKYKLLTIGIVLSIIAGILLLYISSKDKSILISAKEATTILQEKSPSEAIIKGEYIYFSLNSHNYKVAKDSIDLKEIGQQVPIEIQQTSSFQNTIVEILAIVFVVIVILYIIAKLNQKQQNLEIKQVRPNNKKIEEAKELANNAFDLHRIKPIQSNITFDDVAGISEAKDELEEIISYLKEPQKYQEFGIKLPKGVLLVGPPGVGKTLIAKALASEANVPFFYQSGASFVQIYVGMGAKRVNDLFTKAKLNAPSIIFIDEIDAVGKVRGGGRNEEREATLNQLLTEMDGFEDSNGVIVIGATNNIESMDEALLRSGRFDRKIFVELPNLQERIKILEVHTKNKKCNFDYEEVAKLCVSFSGAAIASLINEAALNAIKRKSKVIEKEDILAVKDKVMMGVRKKLSLNDKEKEILAYYQSAKAFSAYWLEVPFEKVTLMNDGIKYIDKEFLGKNELENKIKIHLSGIAALELIYEESYSHCKNDLKDAKNIAYKMVESYGMGEYLIGKEEDTLKILEMCKKDRFDFFKNHKLLLEKLKDKLLESEKLTINEVAKIINDNF